MKASNENDSKNVIDHNAFLLAGIRQNLASVFDWLLCSTLIRKRESHILSCMCPVRKIEIKTSISFTATLFSIASQIIVVVVSAKDEQYVVSLLIIACYGQIAPPVQYAGDK